MKKSIELTEKQGFILWSLYAWFQNDFPKVLSMSRLYDLTENDFRNKHRHQYEKIILKRIVELGKYINEKHPEWIE